MQGRRGDKNRGAPGVRAATEKEANKADERNTEGAT